MNVMGLNGGLLLVLWSIMKIYQVLLLLSTTIFSSFLGGFLKLHAKIQWLNWIFPIEIGVLMVYIYIHTHTIFSHT